LRITVSLLHLIKQKSFEKKIYYKSLIMYHILIII